MLCGSGPRDGNALWTPIEIQDGNKLIVVKCTLWGRHNHLLANNDFCIGCNICFRGLLLQMLILICGHPKYIFVENSWCNLCKPVITSGDSKYRAQASLNVDVMSCTRVSTNLMYRSHLTLFFLILIYNGK